MAVHVATLGRSRLWGFLATRKKRPSVILVPIVILGLFVIVGVFAPLIAPHSPTATDLSIRFQPTALQAGGDWSHPLGTDSIGRDVLSRLIHGARVALIFAFLATAVGGGIGVILGLISGYYGRWIDIIIMRVVDIAMALPVVLIAIALAVALGASMMNLVLVVSLTLWAFYARLVRAETLSIKERDYVALARVGGCSTLRIITRHIFPNLMHSIVVIATLQLGGIILLESAFSFLGIGIPPPSPTWGGMVADGRSVLQIAWWTSIFAGGAIGLVVVSGNLFGDWLRDRLDPRLRQV